MKKKKMKAIHRHQLNQCCINWIWIDMCVVFRSLSLVIYVPIQLTFLLFLFAMLFVICLWIFLGLWMTFLCSTFVLLSVRYVFVFCHHFELYLSQSNVCHRVSTRSPSPLWIFIFMCTISFFLTELSSQQITRRAFCIIFHIPFHKCKPIELFRLLRLNTITATVLPNHEFDIDNILS